MRKEYTNMNLLDGTPIRKLVNNEADYQIVRRFVVDYGYTPEEALKKMKENRERNLKKPKPKQNELEKLKIQFEEMKKLSLKYEYQNNIYFSILSQINGVLLDDYLVDKAKIKEIEKILKKL